MNAKHTPGPWKRQSRNGTTRFRIVDAKGRQVADANHYNERAEENADLLAAAPELLEACRTFAEWLRREDEGFPDAGERRKTPEGEAAWREWWEENLRLCALAQTQVRAALAQATGEQA